MSFMGASRTAQEIYRPYTMQIEDTHGESIILSKSQVSGDVLNIVTNGYNDEGQPTSITVTGNFHNAWKQNAVNSLARFRSQVEKSQQENQALVMIVGHPQIQMRGRLVSLTGPDWTSVPHPILFDYKFDFTRETRPDQPKVFRQPTEVVQAEGMDYVLFTIPTVALSDLKELAYFYYGKNYSDGRRIREIIRLNKFTVTQIRALTSGSIVKMPIAT